MPLHGLFLGIFRGSEAGRAQQITCGRFSLDRSGHDRPAIRVQFFSNVSLTVAG